MTAIHYTTRKKNLQMPISIKKDNVRVTVRIRVKLCNKPNMARKVGGVVRRVHYGLH